MWTCLGFITYVTMVHGVMQPPTMSIIGSYASQSQCLEMCSRWQNKSQRPFVQADSICEHVITETKKYA